MYPDEKAQAPLALDQVRPDARLLTKPSRILTSALILILSLPLPPPLPLPDHNQVRLGANADALTASTCSRRVYCPWRPGMDQRALEHTVRHQQRSTAAGL